MTYLITLRTRKPAPAKAQIVAFLERGGWTFQETIRRRHDNKAIWDSYLKGPLEVKVPASENFSDYAIHCRYLIESLSDVSNTDSLDIYNAIVAEVA